jgi:hypothetical protein
MLWLWLLLLLLWLWLLLLLLDALLDASNAVPPRCGVRGGGWCWCWRGGSQGQ